jgi:hypothetical protein
MENNFLIKTKQLIISFILMPSLLLAYEQSPESKDRQNDLSPPKSSQSQKYIDTSKDCMIVQNKKQIVLKCGNNMIFVTPNGVGIKTPSVSKFWS